MPVYRFQAMRHTLKMPIWVVKIVCLHHLYFWIKIKKNKLSLRICFKKKQKGRCQLISQLILNLDQY